MLSRDHITQPDSTQFNLTGQFSGHSARFAVVTELATQYRSLRLTLRQNCALFFDSALIKKLEEC